MLLDRVGLGDRFDHEPSQMSGGQQQRVAIARSLVNQPALLLADEPTGNLDSRTSVEILRMFQRLNAEGITILLVTHDPEVAKYAHRVIRIHDGRIIEDGPSEGVPRTITAASPLAQTGAVGRMQGGLQSATRRASRLRLADGSPPHARRFAAGESPRPVGPPPARRVALGPTPQGRRRRGSCCRGAEGGAR